MGKLPFWGDALKQKSVFCLRQVGNEFPIPSMILECLMGHQVMPLDHQDRHFHQLACDWACTSNPKLLELIAKFGFHSENQEYA
jgi:hypothetical protein